MSQRQHGRLPRGDARTRRAMSLWSSNVIDKVAIGGENKPSLLNVAGDVGLLSVTEPPDPPSGYCVMWMSDGVSGAYDAGEVIIKTNVGGHIRKRAINHDGFEATYSLDTGSGVLFAADDDASSLVFDDAEVFVSAG